MTGTTTIEVDSQVGCWRVLRIAHKRALCRCKCNSVHEVAIAALEDGTSLSCGCSAISLPKNNNRVFRLPHWRPERGR